MGPRCPQGHEVGIGAVFCHLCGARVAPDPKDQTVVQRLFRDEPKPVITPPPPPPEVSRLITLGLPLLALGIMIFGGLLLAGVVSSGGGGNASGFQVHPIGPAGSSGSKQASTPAAPAVPQAAFPLPAGATMCPSTGTGPYDGVAVAGGTSCDFAGAVHDAYAASHGDGSPITLQQVTNPTTHKWFTTRCNSATPVVCTALNDQTVYLGAVSH